MKCDHVVVNLIWMVQFSALLHWLFISLKKKKLQIIDIFKTDPLVGYISYMIYNSFYSHQNITKKESKPLMIAHFLDPFCVYVLFVCLCLFFIFCIVLKHILLLSFIPAILFVVSWFQSQMYKVHNFFPSFQMYCFKTYFVVKFYTCNFVCCQLISESNVQSS